MINRQLPVIDLHRHLDGNIRPQTILDLAQQYGVSLPAMDLDHLLPLVQIQDKTSDLLAFLQRLDYGVSVLKNTDACYRVAYENMQDAKQEGLDYIELRFSPFYMAEHHGLNIADVTEAVIQGVEDGQKEYGVRANLIGILSRTYGAEQCLKELDGLLAHKSHITGLDLAGDELGFPAEWFVDHFAKARNADWHITVHAGEADGPDSVSRAINLLGAQRIGHGVAAIKDDNLLRQLANARIPIESCPTSNYQTATVQDLAAHPMKVFLEKGLCVTLNTDDPGVSAIDLAHEYQVAHDVIGISQSDLEGIQRNAVEAAFLSDSEKRTLFAHKL
ncbi:adenosine deaminase [Alteromonas oceanisediminis]|uniref:adenosine deaminase n=1 Tax=Alteromonas oceanisediminis TaxID=2836180 RepID=UPI001BDB1AAE|nr:adenosine deaminase [Alteromonas oceanisediminis]MBT0587139.1 adenosine deaminase [Alteromonas oceanisediminis]